MLTVWQGLLVIVLPPILWWLIPGVFRRTRLKAATWVVRMISLILAWTFLWVWSGLSSLLPLVVALILTMLIEGVLRMTRLKAVPWVTRMISLTLALAILGIWLGFDWFLEVASTALSAWLMFGIGLLLVILPHEPRGPETRV